MRNLAKKGYLFGLLLTTIVISTFSFEFMHHFRAPGNFNTGHENLACIECHESAEGSFRQQIQANLAYILGHKSTTSAFNYLFPDNNDCLACHYREDDNHAVYRFNEPRFMEARKAIQPQFCVSCHKEHTGVRVSSDPENCQHCHEDIKVRYDPLDISHKDLITLKDWITCLRCHDFHGNHIMKLSTKISGMLKISEVKSYFSGGNDPYSKQKIVNSKDSRYDN